MIDDKDVHIRIMVEADAFYLRKWLMDPQIMRYFPMSNLAEVEDAIKIWQVYARLGSAYTVEVKGQPAGCVNLYVQPYEKLKHQALFAILISEKFRGQGIGTKLLQFLMKEAKNKFGITLLHLEVFQDNPAYNLYYRLGFREYARHKRFLKEADGSYQTKVMMQIDLSTKGES